MSGICFGQKIRVDGFNRDFEKYRNTTDFDYIHADYDTTKLTWIADFTVKFDTIIHGMLGECYKILQERANRFGANSYRVLNSNLLSNNEEKYISIEVFWNRMEDRDENQSHFISNTLYLFGYLGYHSEIDGYKVAINDQEFVMRALTFRKFEFLDDQKISLTLGSKSRGDSKTIHIRDGMKPKYFYFNMVRGQFKNAYMSEYDESFAQFLINILPSETN